MDRMSDQNRDPTLMNHGSAQHANFDFPDWWDDWQLLVDGELESTRRPELLRRIDQTPDGWRQCAIALLDEWYLKQELQQLAAAPPRLYEPAGGATLPQRAPDTRNVLWPIAAAVCLALVAFTAGYSLSQWRSGKLAELARQAPAGKSLVEPTRQAPDRSMAGANRERHSLESEVWAATGEPLFWINVPLPLDEGQDPTWVRIPIQYAVTYPGEVVVDAAREPLDRLAKKIATLGGDVHRKSYWYGYQLGESCQLWVPVEDWRGSMPENVDWQSLFEEVQP
ncbi:MAG: hypothetical protein KatS3mg110_2031 [Pirellulaceae bacterium]|nr:MAG: hypothetical protein KatS3mg110_2031 [Pirellulaceae bacterium]